jgi:hypothetical protein
MKLPKRINYIMALGTLFYMLWSASPAIAQPPIRDPHTPGYVLATELPDGANPSPDSNGNFIIGPTHDAAPESTAQANVPQGAIYHFTMDSKDSKIYPGIAREPNTFGTPDPANPATLIVTTSHPAPYTRQVAVYVPKQYAPVPRRRLSLAPMGQTICYLRYWTT